MRRFLEIFRSFMKYSKQMIVMCIFFISLSGIICERRVACASDEKEISCTEVKKFNDIICKHIPTEVYHYANDNYLDFCMTSEEDISRKIDYYTLEIMKPFIIYEADCLSNQVADFYFPIRDKEGIFMIFQVIQTDSGINGAASVSLCNLINIKTYDQTIFYKLDGKVFADNTMMKLNFNELNRKKNNYTAREKKFCYSSMREKINTISQNTKKFHKIQIDNLKNKDANVLQEYMPGFSVEGKGKRVCNTGKYMVSQENKPICWAACVASTYNYFFNKHITAKSVSKKILGKYSGTDSKTVVKAFAKYNMDVYKHMNNNPSYDKIELSISHMRLLTIIGYDGITKHDVVLTGFSYSNKSKKIKIYDPSDNTWRWVVYKPGKTIFPSAGSDYLWIETYYVYR